MRFFNISRMPFLEKKIEALLFIPTFGSQRQEDCHKLEAIQDYTVRPCLKKGRKIKKLSWQRDHFALLICIIDFLEKLSK